MSVAYIVSPSNGDLYATIFSNTSLTTKAGTVKAGTSVMVTSATDAYYRIKYNTNNKTNTNLKVQTNGTLFVRVGPSSSAKYYGKGGDPVDTKANAISLKNGTRVTVSHTDGLWVCISGGEVHGGWVEKRFITEMAEEGYGYISANDIRCETGTGELADDAAYVSQMVRDMEIRAKLDRNFDASAYNVSSEYRYLGTNSYYKEMMSTINYCFGCPPKYNMDIDIQYVSDVGIGRVLSQTFYSNPTILSICPGKVRMFPHIFNSKARDTAFNQLKSAAAGDESVVSKILADKDSDILNGPLYEFNQDTADFAKRVNLLCRACAIMLGIGDERMPYTNIKLKSFDYAYWSIRKKYQPQTGKQQNVFTDFWSGGFEALVSGVTDQNYIHFLVNGENTSISEDINTSVESSFFEQLIGGANSIASQLSYLTGIGYTGLADTQLSISGMLDSVVGANGWTKLVNNVVSGGKLKIPKVVADTDYSHSASCSLTFVSPYGNPKAVFLWCLVPICHLWALSLPKQLSDSMYSYPYIIKVYQKGWFNSNLAVISSMNVTRGGSDGTSWSTAGLATEWTANFSITPLYSQLTLPSTDHPFLFMKNDGLIDYLGNMCGFDLKANNLDVKFNLLKSFIINRFTGIPNDIQRWVSDKLSDTVSKIFHFG